MLRQATTSIEVAATRPGLVDVTARIRSWSEQHGIATGLLTIYCQHTSASLLIQENAAPEVRSDLEAYFARLAPEHRSLYAHDDEGPDDMPAHLRAALTQTQVSVPLIDDRLALGRWQGIYLFEHRRAPHRRTLVLHLIGE